MIEEAIDIYDQLEDMCWETPIFRYIREEIDDFSMKWFVENEQKVYEWWEKQYEEFSSDVKGVWDDAKSAAKKELEEDYDEDEITDEMIASEAEGLAQMFYDDIGENWSNLIKLVQFRDDDDLLWKVGMLEDDIDDCYKTINNEMPDLIKEKIREIFED